MTGRAAHGGQAKTVIATRDGRLMESAGVALARAILSRVAVHAARMRKHFGGLGE
jgi:hypothetical protein